MALSNKDRQAAFKERKRLEAEQAVEAAAMASQLFTKDREQLIRDKFGYRATETRTERERSDAAARMLNRDPDEYWVSRHPEELDD